jgi:hypothetical protein
LATFPKETGQLIKPGLIGAETLELRTLARSVPVEQQHRRAHRRLLQLFVACEIVCQLALLTPWLAAFRLVWRTAPFALSLGLLALLPGRGRLHPAARPALLVFVILGLSFLNPAGDTLMARAAQIAMYAAILAPLFWVSRLRIDRAAMRRVLLIFWGFQTISAAVGVLQVYFPGHFEFNVSAVILAGSPEALKYRNASGAMVFRPMGLTDVPGGAATAGLYAAIFGMAFFVNERRPWKQALFAASIFAGSVVIYLSQVRATLVMLAVSSIVFIGVIIMHNWQLLRVPHRSPRIKLARLTAVILAAALAGLSSAVAIGGNSIIKRLSTLDLENAGEVYHENRGQFLQETLDTLLPQYPLGAGLGRWGMMNYYFGDKSDPQKALWAEIQWTGWLFDGGILLILAYVAALLLAMAAAYRIALDPGLAQLAVWGAMTVAYSASVLALTFDYAFFQSQGGMDFWLLNAMLFAVAWQQRPAGRRRAAFDRYAPGQRRLYA